MFKGPFRLLSDDLEPKNSKEIDQLFGLALRRTVQLLKGKDIWLLGQHPKHDRDMGRYVIRETLLGRPLMTVGSQQMREADKLVSRRVPKGVHYMETIDAFCGDTCTYVEDNVPFYTDGVHLGRVGAIRLLPVLEGSLPQFFGQVRARLQAQAEAG